MRLGEIKQKIDRVVAENFTIVIKNQPLYGEQAQEITNYGDIVEALEILSKFKWNDVTKVEVEEITRVYPKQATSILPLADFNKLSAIIGRVNTTLPLYYSILDTMVEKQDEKVINIQLPGKIKSLSDLNEFNTRLSKLLKSFQIDGEFEFQQFDKGTSWYEVCVISVLTYKYFVGCLKIAQEYFKTETEYFKSREAQIAYEATKISLNNQKEITFNEYKQNWLRVLIEKEVVSLVTEKIKELNGHSLEELQTKLVTATTALVKELGEGTEFHLSLNPPQYVKEQAGQLVIEYKKIKEVNGLDKSKQNQIAAPTTEKKDDNANIASE